MNFQDQPVPEILPAQRKELGQVKSGFLWKNLVLVGIFVLVILISGCFANVAAPKAEASLANEISVDEAYAKYQQGMFLLDVRQPEEWQEAHIPNTTLIPLGELESRLNELPKDKPIVVVCRSGNRSQAGRDILKKADFNNVTSMAGGINQWRAQGYPTTSGP